MRKATCTRCGKETMVNRYTVNQIVEGELCAVCFDVVEHDKPEQGRVGIRRFKKSSDDLPFDDDD